MAEEEELRIRDRSQGIYKAEFYSVQKLKNSKDLLIIKIICWHFTTQTCLCPYKGKNACNGVTIHYPQTNFIWKCLKRPILVYLHTIIKNKHQRTIINFCICVVKKVIPLQS